MAEENKQSTINPPVQAFLESCLLDKGIRDVPEELKAQMVEDLGSRLQDWLMQTVITKLDEQDMPAMDELMERGATQEEITGFLQSRIPDIDKVFEQAMFEFKQAYLSA
jgi:hypothetical protein